jgi:hypothetical protein
MRQSPSDRMLPPIEYTRAVNTCGDSRVEFTKTMKTILTLALLSIALTTSGCFVYEQRTVPNRVVVHETTVSPAPQRVVTVLPTGYRTRVYRGVNYYTYDNVYYRTYPSGGYEVVQRPWD